MLKLPIHSNEVAIMNEIVKKLINNGKNFTKEDALEFWKNRKQFSEQDKNALFEFLNKPYDKKTDADFAGMHALFMPISDGQPFEQPFKINADILTSVIRDFDLFGSESSAEKKTKNKNYFDFIINDIELLKSFENKDLNLFEKFVDYIKDKGSTAGKGVLEDDFLKDKKTLKFYLDNNKIIDLEKARELMKSLTSFGEKDISKYFSEVLNKEQEPKIKIEKISNFFKDNSFGLLMDKKKISPEEFKKILKFFMMNASEEDLKDTEIFKTFLDSNYKEKIIKLIDSTKFEEKAKIVEQLSFLPSELNYNLYLKELEERFDDKKYDKKYLSDQAIGMIEKIILNQKDDFIEKAEKFLLLFPQGLIAIADFSPEMDNHIKAKLAETTLDIIQQTPPSGFSNYEEYMLSILTADKNSGEYKENVRKLAEIVVNRYQESLGIDFSITVEVVDKIESSGEANTFAEYDDKTRVLRIDASDIETTIRKKRLLKPDVKIDEIEGFMDRISHEVTHAYQDMLGKEMQILLESKNNKEIEDLKKNNPTKFKDMLLAYFNMEHYKGGDYYSYQEIEQQAHSIDDIPEKVLNAFRTYIKKGENVSGDIFDFEKSNNGLYSIKFEKPLDGNTRK